MKQKKRINNNSGPALQTFFIPHNGEENLTLIDIVIIIGKVKIK